MRKKIGIVFLFFWVVLLSGCATHNIQMYEPPVYKAPIPKQEAIPIPEVKPEPPLRYGRFEVKKNVAGGYQVVGGKFTPTEPPVDLPVTAPVMIFVNATTKELTAFRYNYLVGLFEGIAGYAVVTPDHKSLPKNVVVGEVTKIDTKPSWCPTANILRHKNYRHLQGRGCLPFGDPDNAMGAVKFEINWNVPNWQAVRLHGTYGYADDGKFWEIETFGCTRLQDEAILELTEKIKKLYDGSLEAAVKAGIKVVVFR